MRDIPHLGVSVLSMDEPFIFVINLIVSLYLTLLS